jgi:hypothetical protein
MARQRRGREDGKHATTGAGRKRTLTDAGRNAVAYTAGPGWDACTGLGTPDGTALLASLSTG